jgi:hypothetical protein
MIELDRKMANSDLRAANLPIHHLAVQSGFAKTRRNKNEKQFSHVIDDVLPVAGELGMGAITGVRPCRQNQFAPAAQFDG